VIAFNFLAHYFGVLDLYPSVEGDNRDVSAAATGLGRGNG
jgi:hypothetical protein